jgi:hypothetical protein
MLNSKVEGVGGRGGGVWLCHKVGALARFGKTLRRSSCEV